ncbi:SgcJ/EcaC family oxidoreductase [Actinoplanes sichuanensis]|uniref:SgcJ/EcaC family oxidoreductase n=1 Tax=Actinoplanes sichuanensis TaxID=512349 RepID=A0ABW4AK91_9ACTN|nr:SgcJ/EcaC family oxidoreductase [Actinoplanes sichuanensis]
MGETRAESVVRELYRELLTAWNERDAERFAGLFADDGVLIGFDGSQVDGPEIGKHLTPIFQDHPTAAYVARIREIRVLGPGAVLLRSIAGMIPPGTDTLNPATNAVQTLVAERRLPGWRVILFQNTPAQYHGHPEATAAHTAELEPQAAEARLLT